MSTTAGDVGDGVPEVLRLGTYPAVDGLSDPILAGGGLQGYLRRGEQTHRVPVRSTWRGAGGGRRTRPPRLK
jgi:hypothetical protein